MHIIYVKSMKSKNSSFPRCVVEHSRKLNVCISLVARDYPNVVYPYFRPSFMAVATYA